MSAAEIGRLLRDPVVQRDVAVSTQNQAVSARLFLFRTALGANLPWMESAVRAERPRRAESD